MKNSIAIKKIYIAKKANPSRMKPIGTGKICYYKITGKWKKKSKYEFVCGIAFCIFWANRSMHISKYFNLKKIIACLGHKKVSLSQNSWKKQKIVKVKNKKPIT